MTPYGAARHREVSTDEGDPLIRELICPDVVPFCMMYGVLKNNIYVFLSSLCVCSMRKQAEKPNTCLCYHVSLRLRDVYRALSEYSIAAGGCYRHLSKRGPYYPAITTR